MSKYDSTYIRRGIFGKKVTYLFDDVRPSERLAITHELIKRLKRCHYIRF